jgi:hypothetical protein
MNNDNQQQLLNALQLLYAPPAAAPTAADHGVSAAANKGVAAFSVPTKGSPSTQKKKSIDTADLSEDDLKTLKKQDPFLYYSIPTVRNAAVRRGSMDTPSSVQQDTGLDTQSRRVSCPDRIESSPTKVERQTRISFECYSDVFFGEVSDGEDMDEEDDADVDFDSLFDGSFRSSMNDSSFRSAMNDGSFRSAMIDGSFRSSIGGGSSSSTAMGDDSFKSGDGSFKSSEGKNPM